MEKQLIGKVNEFVIKPTIDCCISQLSQTIAGISADTTRVLKFINDDELQEIFIDGGKKVLVRFEEYLKEQLSFMKKEVEIYQMEESIPYYLNEFKFGLHLIKSNYDALVKHIPSEIISTSRTETGFSLDIDKAKIDDAIEELRKVYIETPEQQELFDLASQVCVKLDKMIELTTQPSFFQADPISLFAYKYENGNKRQATINTDKLINYFKLLQQ